MVAVSQPQHCSYREALEATTKVVQPSKRGGGNSAIVTSKGTCASLCNGQGHGRGHHTIELGTV